MKDQVCTLETARALRDAGLRQESLFYWVNNNLLVSKNGIPYLINVMVCHPPAYVHKDDGLLIPLHEDASAFTAQELFEILPPYIEREGMTYYPIIKPRSIQYSTMRGDNEFLYPFVRGENLADTMGKMILELMK